MRLFDSDAFLNEIRSRKAQAASEISTISQISTPRESKVEAVPEDYSTANEANSANRSSTPPELLAQEGPTKTPQRPVLHEDMAETLKCTADQKASEHNSGDKADVLRGSTLSTFGVFTAVEKKELFAFPPDVEEGLKSLRDDQPRGDYDQERWCGVFRDIMQFAQSWANHPLGIGWTVEELFGANPEQPMALSDCAGLTLQLQGEPVRMLNRDYATVGQTGRSTLHRIRRGATTGTVPIWAIPPRIT